MFATPGNLGCPKGAEKSELFAQETYHTQNFGYETLKSPLLKNYVCPSYIINVKVTNN